MTGLPDDRVGGGYSVPMMYAAATMYYLEDATQAGIADKLGVSRPTVSRLLAEARRRGIVRIEVVTPPEVTESGLANHVAELLGLTRVHLAPAVPPGASGASLAPTVSLALREVGLRSGDVLLVSSGRTVFEVSNADLPPLPGVVLAPTIGGHDEPEGWYQPNEIVRRFARKVGGVPQFLFAPAMPSRALRRSFLGDAGTRRVLDLWSAAKCALLGVGAPPLTRSSLPRFVERSAALEQSVGDVCSRFYDSDGQPVPWEGAERLMAMTLDQVRAVPVGIAVAYGESKVAAIRAGAAAGYFDRLVTDVPTATALATSAEFDVAETADISVARRRRGQVDGTGSGSGHATEARFRFSSDSGGG